MLRWLRGLVGRVAPAPALSEADRIVLDLVGDRGEVSWERLVREAADVGIGEAELHEIVYGKPLPQPRVAVQAVVKR